MGIQDILTVMDLLRTLPATSVVNEASFNQMKMTKTNRRQRLSNKHLDDCMVIQLESTDILNFDPTEAINKWMTSSKQPRRLTYARSTCNKNSEQQDEDIMIQEVTQDEEPRNTTVAELDPETADDCDYETDCDSDNEQTEDFNDRAIEQTVHEMEIEINY
ncbi:uncharacterized protein LOC130051023 [Ostrea edulis]|uniref:uncharacterized protein LOC130051023 n=1 Tax=Ostrea edulis TaxID=37623 RepID=UPI0024AEB1F0|nr:uncharacterized protein LOC130051023 [Ostrea edulis]